MLFLFFFFFFQAEDGIRDLTVTGVQTCALPIWRLAHAGAHCRADRVVLRDPPALSERAGQSPATRRHPAGAADARDRKSTRLNSSHSQISYAVFCLKKKKKTEARPHTHMILLHRVTQSHDRDHSR